MRGMMMRPCGVGPRYVACLTGRAGRSPGSTRTRLIGVDAAAATAEVVGVVVVDGNVVVVDFLAATTFCGPSPAAMHDPATSVTAATAARTTRRPPALRNIGRSLRCGRHEDPRLLPCTPGRRGHRNRRDHRKSGQGRTPGRTRHRDARRTRRVPRGLPGRRGVTGRTPRKGDGRSGAGARSGAPGVPG